MSMERDVKQIKGMIKILYSTIVGLEENQIELEKEYFDYKKFDTPRGERLLIENGVFDEYNSYLSAYEQALLSNEKGISTMSSLPKPSDALKKFKDKFDKLF